MNKTNYLYDVALLRPLAVLLLILYHALIPYIHGWEQQPPRFEDIETYWWIAKSIISCIMELFVFISGYVFAFSLQTKPRSFSQILKNKIKRLYIPCVLFSFIYILIFYEYKDLSIPSFLIKLLEGAGHLWFLPMLFWCTIIVFIIYKLSLSSTIKFLICISLIIISIIPFPIGISSSCYYAFFFYLGMVLYDKRSREVRANSLILVGVCFICIFIIGTIIIRDFIPPLSCDDTCFFKVIKLELLLFIKTLCSFLGVLFFFLIINYLLQLGVQIPSEVLNFNSSCFGLYLFQQFILMGIYFYTPLPELLGAYVLPWVGFILALICSYVLTMLVRSTRIGKAII